MKADESWIRSGAQLGVIAKRKTMTKTTINYLFPPDQISYLPTWRFVLHFKAPKWFSARKTNKALAALKAIDFKALHFPFGLDEPIIDNEMGTVGIPVQVTPERRAEANSLTDYESDVWKIYGNMIQYGFGDLYYEAVDWKELA